MSEQIGLKDNHRDRVYVIETPDELDVHLKSGRKWVSNYFLIDKPRIVHFAEATGDTQWIHTADNADIKKRLELVSHGFGEDPFDRTIAHGYYSLAMFGSLLGKAVNMRFVKLVINYGLDYVRFTTPVPVDSKVRGVFSINKWEWIVDEKDPEKKNGVKIWWDQILQVQGKQKPACYATSIILYYFDKNYAPSKPSE
jgi:acyl dehydratase